MAKKYLNLGPILKKLLFERNISETDLANAVGLPQPTINRIVNGKSTRPYESSLKPIADYFSITLPQLLGEKSLNKYENNDSSKHFSFYNPQRKTDSLAFIPWLEMEFYNKKEFSKSIPFYGEISDKSFATIMPNNSMEPLIKEGAMLIFDPFEDYVDGSFILTNVKKEDLFLVRQILFRGKDRYLTSLNSNSINNTILLTNDDIIIASLVEIRHNLKLIKNQRYME